MSNTTDTCVTLRSDKDVFLDSLCYDVDQAKDGVWIGSGASPRSSTDTPNTTVTSPLSGSIFS